MHAVGKDLGGIRTLDGLRDRCRIDAETGCWNWAGATSGPRHETRVWLATENRGVTAQRAALILSKRTLGARVWRTCGNLMCCNPRHLMTGSGQEYGAWVREAGILKGDPRRAAANRAAVQRRAGTVLSPEVAEWIRQSPQTGRDIAAMLGISESAVSRVRMGQAWRPTAKNASVFAWAA